MSTKKGFTLIELLVVIAIIALLLAILMPALGKAKIIAEEVLCKSNLHQYHLATQLYLQEQDTKFPDAHRILYQNNPDNLGDQTDPKEKANGWSRSHRWHNEGMSLDLYPELAGPFWQYVPDTKVNICPSFAKLGKGGHPPCSVPTFKVQFTYSMNYHLREKRIGKVRSPSETFIWAEENSWKLNDLANFVLNDNALWIRPPSVGILDNFASFHKISKAKLNIQRSTETYDGGVANVLLLDGSNTFISPEDSLRYTGEY